MKVKDVMSTDVRACEPCTGLAEAAMMMWHGDLGFLPVVENGTLVGCITDRDICMAAATHSVPASHVTVGEIITHRIEACRPDDDTREALRLMGSHQVRRLPVTGPGGRLEGVVSMNDLVLEASGRRGPLALPTYGDVVSALKAISRHRDPAAGGSEAAA